MKPKFCRLANGDLVMGNSTAAVELLKRGTRSGSTAEASKVIHQRSVDAVRKEGGDVESRTAVLGHYHFQMGKFKGQTFKWIVENALGYAAWLVDNMQANNEKVTEGVALSENKHAFREYLTTFKEGKEAVDIKTSERLRKLTSAELHKLYGPDKARQMIRARTSAQIVVRPNIPATATDPGSDDDLAKALDSYEERVRNTPQPSAKKASTTPVVRAIKPTSTITSAQDLPPLLELDISSRAPVCVSETSTLVAVTPTASLAFAPSTVSAVEQVKSAKAALDQSGVGFTVETDNTTQSPCSGTTTVVNVTATVSSTPSAFAQLKSVNTDIDIPKYWHDSFPSIDRKWAARAIFSWSTQGIVVVNQAKANKLWFYPPQPQPLVTTRPRLENYFGQRILFWQPLRLWQLQLRCPSEVCKGELKASGLHRTVREVLDIDSFYTLIGESYKCKTCGRNEISWNRSILDQLDPGHRSMFPVIMLYKTACDVRVIRLLRQRGLGNSASQLQRKIREQHSEEWANKHLRFFSDCQTYQRAITQRLVEANFESPPSMKPVPGYQWFQAVYAEDAMVRLNEVKAAITSVFGRVLKMDSTKKITKKLAGKAANTAGWCTNIGNEYGQVVQSVMTAAEGGLVDDMLLGIIRRYREADVPPPELLYVDSHCCGTSRNIFLLTEAWPHLRVRLDVWHFMRRFNSAVTTDTHRLYPTFMGQLSHAIFQWDSGDLDLLKMAKKQEMLKDNISSPSDQDILRRITRKELALHCRRTTRGTEETTKMLLALFTMFDSDQGKDTMGVPLLNHDRIWEQWRTNKQHIACIQDPPNVDLYTQTGSLKKGGVELPVYRCARGSTSLESYHLHLNRFIPGTTASDVHLQAFLLEGMMRWNQDREAEATTAETGAFCYSGHIKQCVNTLGMAVFGSKLYPDYKPPRAYTGELIGVDYLYNQTGKVLEPPVYTAEGEHVIEAPTEPDETEESVPEDEGFEDDPTISQDIQFLPNSAPLAQVARSRLYSVPEPGQSTSSEEPTLCPVEEHVPSTSVDEHRPCPVEEHVPSTLDETRPGPVVVQGPSKSSDEPGPCTVEKQLLLTSNEPALTASLADDTEHETRGPDNVPGYDSVQNLAHYLVGLLNKKTKVITSEESTQIIMLWNRLDPYDLAPTKYAPLHRVEHIRGRFKNPKSFRADTIAGVHSVRRCALAPGLGPATRPDANRYMEAILLRLCRMHPASTVKQGRRYGRWTLVLADYKDIVDMVHNCGPIMDQTALQLSHISQATLSAWYNDLEKKRERQLLEQGLQLQTVPVTAPQPLPEARKKQASITTEAPPGKQHSFVIKENTVGLRTKARRKMLLEDASTVVDPTPAKRPVTLLPALQLTAAMIQPTEAAPPARIPYSTKHYNKRKLEKEQAGEFKRSYCRTVEVIVCKKCGSDKNAGGHRQHYGNIYCPSSCTVPYEEWKQQFQGKYVKKKK